MTSQRATPKQRSERAQQDARFGKIGISAVAAAVRYQSVSKNTTDGPTKLSDYERVEEAA